MKNLKNKLMKLAALGIAAILAVGCLAGCGSDSDERSSKKDTKTEEKSSSKDKKNTKTEEKSSPKDKEGGSKQSDDKKAGDAADNMMEAMISGDAKGVVDCLPDSLVDAMCEESGMSESDVVDFMDEMLSEIEDELADAEYELGDVRDATDDEMEETAGAYEELDVEIDDLKYVTVEAEGETVEMGVIKVDGNWYADFYSMSKWG